MQAGRFVALLGKAALSLAGRVKAMFARGEKGVWFDPSDLTQSKLTYRRNLLTYSAQFDRASWGLTGCYTVTADTVIAPDGTTTADTLVRNGVSTGSWAELVQNVTVGAGFNVGKAYTGSVWLWCPSGTVAGSLSISDAAFNTYNSAINITTAPTRFTFTASGGAGWNPAGASIGLGVNVAKTSTVYAWGAQLEIGLVATTYQKITDYYTEFASAFPLTALYQDSSGMTPVTAVEQPVGLMLDKSQGVVVLGSNIAPAFSLGGWVTNDPSWQAVGNTAVATNCPVGKSFYQVGLAGQNRVYKYTVTVSSLVTGSITVSLGGVGSAFINSAGTFSGVIFCGAGNSNVNLITQGASNTLTVSSLIVQELAGNHATQPTAINRPVISARYNSLLSSESFDAAIWSKMGATSVSPNTVIAPDGSLTGDTVNLGSSGADRLEQQVASTPVVGNTFVYAIYLKGSGTVNITITSTTGSNNYESTVTLTNSWVRYTQSCTWRATDSGSPRVFVIRRGGNTAATLSAWGADFRSATGLPLNLPAYQRVNTATDYDTVNFPPYLSFNGTNQWMVTPSIDFTATDKMTVWAGMSKLSDAGNGTVAELSSVADSSPGAFYLRAPSGGSANYQYLHRGVTASDSYTPSAVSPSAAVLTMQSVLAAPSSLTGRLNGVGQVIATGVTGGGNFGNYPIYIGARAGTSLYFNGRIYGLIVRGAASSPQEISAGGRYINSKTGAY